MNRPCFWLLIVGLLLPGSLHAQETGPGWCVSVWYPSSDTPGGADSIRANLDEISVVNPFWYSPLADGTLQAHPGAEDPELLAEWREAGLAVIPTIFSSVWQLLQPPETQAFHIDQIIALVERMDYDGIDIDYEGFPLSTRDDFSDFIESLAAKLHARGRLLSIAVHAKTDDAGTWEGAAAQDWTRLAPPADVFAIMTYDYTGRNDPPGPIGPTDWVLDVLSYAASVTDLAKVRMGLPFYGYTWKRDKPPATTTSWMSAQRLIESFGLDVQRDPSDMEAHIDFKAPGLPKQTLYLADSVEIDYKLKRVLEAYPELGGIAIWGIGGEDPANWDILRAAHRSDCTFDHETTESHT